MTIYYINTGSGPNSGDGDSLRTAFNKVNANFSEVDSRIIAAGVQLIESSTPPHIANSSTIWYNIESKRTYVFYNEEWVDANPTVDSYVLPTATTSSLGGMIVGAGLQVDNSGTVSVIGVYGPQGAQGFQGYQGFQGAQGFQGYQGSVGVQGARGFQGDIGYQGYQGDIGYQGYQGDIGYQGYQGDIGYQGYQGDIGYQGFPGVQGPVGNANLPADSVGFLYDNGSGALSWKQPNILSSGTYNLVLSSDGILRLNGNIFSSGSGSGGTTSTLINTVSTSTLKIVAPPAALYGSLADLPGNVAFDTTFIYYCTGTYGTVYSGHPIQAGTNVNRVYLRQSDLPVQPQPGWVFQSIDGGPIYTVTQVFSGIFFSPLPITSYYQLNIASSVLTYTTQTTYLVAPISTNKIWNTTPWNAISDLTTTTQHIIPAENLTYDLGSPTYQWRSLYVGTSTIYIGGAPLSVTGNDITLNGSVVTGGGGPYFPTQQTDWNGSPPTTLSEAIDRLASVIKTLNGGTGA